MKPPLRAPVQVRVRSSFQAVQRGGVPLSRCFRGSCTASRTVGCNLVMFLYRIIDAKRPS